MLHYTTGDLLESSAQALVNTVNCEGYMGKGIAYQFKRKFPANNDSYVAACRSGTLRPGMLHYFTEKGKIIVNFPTKDKWRGKTKLSYIEDGLDALVSLVRELNIHSIAIPPLGCGNGGLNWLVVKKIVEEKMRSISGNVDIIVYEPSGQYNVLPAQELRLGLPALILMDIKESLLHFTGLRLQMAAYFMDLFSDGHCFQFELQEQVPHARSIESICRDIRVFQQQHGDIPTREARVVLYQKLVSSSVDRTIKRLAPSLRQACQFVDGVSEDCDLECMAAICFAVEKAGFLCEDEILAAFSAWPAGETDRFPASAVRRGIDCLEEAGILIRDMTGACSFPWRSA